jgi:proline iminopeptidase
MKTKIFPSLEPLEQGWLEVGEGHAMHWQASGNPSGSPVVWLHGGPGSSASPLHRRMFDPSKFWVIQYDQRGCGRSLPLGAIHANQTADLIQDIERLREHLGLERWAVVGGSWGGALALLYAQTFPGVVSRMLLRSPFLCTAAEIRDFTESPPQALRARWQLIRDEMPAESTETVLAFGYRTFCLENDVKAQLKLARAWLFYEAAMNVYPAMAPDIGAPQENALIARYRVQSHYLQHGCFLNQELLSRAAALSKLDLTLIHGELDALCPFDNSVRIQSLVPQAQLVSVKGSGHDLTDEGMLAATFAAIQKWP